MIDEQRLAAIEAVQGDVNSATVLELVADIRGKNKLLADTHRLLKPLEWIEDRGRECSWCGATRHIFGPNRKARDNHREGCAWLALWKATAPFAPKEAPKPPSDDLPQDRHDPEREWFFPGVKPGITIDLSCDGTGRSMGWAEWAGADRRYYDFMAGYGHIPSVWAGSAYPKAEWSEAQARDYHESRVAKFKKDAVEAGEVS